jgi:hypothetical protein
MNITILILLLITVMNIMVGSRIKEPFIGKRVVGGVIDAVHTAGVKAVKDNMTKSQKVSYKPVFKNLKKTVESFREALVSSNKNKGKKRKKDKK